MSGIAEIREEKIQNNSMDSTSLTFNDVSYICALSAEDNNKMIYATINNSHQWNIYSGDRMEGFTVYDGEKEAQPIDRGLTTPKMIRKIEELSISSKDMRNNHNGYNFHRIKANSNVHK